MSERRASVLDAAKFSRSVVSISIMMYGICGAAASLKINTKSIRDIS